MAQIEAVSLADEAFTTKDNCLDGMYVFREGRYIGGFANPKPGRSIAAEASRLADDG